MAWDIDFYHPLEDGRTCSCVVAIADHIVYLCAGEVVLLVHIWCLVRWSGRVAPQFPRRSSTCLNVTNCIPITVYNNTRRILKCDLDTQNLFRTSSSSYLRLFEQADITHL